MEKNDAELLVGTIVDSNNDVAQKLVDSNERETKKILSSEMNIAVNLDQHNKKIDNTTQQRFDKQKLWAWTSITLNLITLVILVFFTIAFFQFAIIVRTP